ncbi:MAG: hypothetical protein ACI9HI_000742 [Salinirussus sp.]|jgi:hypothetical protein
MRDTPLDDSLGGPDVETVTVAGVAVPTTCRDRVDDETLADAVAVLEEYGVTDYTVSPVGGLQIQVGVHRPETVQDALYDSLSRVGDGVTDHGMANGFHRLRVDVTATAGDEDGEDSADGDDVTGDTRRRE